MERLGMTEGELTMLAAELFEITAKFEEIRKKYNLKTLDMTTNSYSSSVSVHEVVNKDDVAMTLTEIAYREKSIIINEPFCFDSENNLIKGEK